VSSLIDRISTFCLMLGITRAWSDGLGVRVLKLRDDEMLLKVA
jgi:hypothetical protein